MSARAVWRGLAREGSGFTDEELEEALAGLEREGKYDKYLDVVERLLLPRVRQAERSTAEEQQWRQAVVAATIFAGKCEEEARWSLALSTLQRAQEMVAADPHMHPAARRELHGFVLDGFASYYYRRRKLQAALQASRRATRAHASLSQWTHVAKCLLHTACVLARLNKHGEAARTIGRVLKLLEADKLEGQGDTRGATPHKLCLLSVAYHNAAVEHLAAGQGEDACVASQNARRLARLCLGLSARFAPALEATHAAALAQLEKARGIAHTFGLDGSEGGGGGGGREEEEEARGVVGDRQRAFRGLAAALYT